jgi:cytochrome P450
VDLIPVEVDPPRHRLYREIINRHFTPAVLAPMEPSLRNSARQLIDQILETDHFEFEVRYGRPYPVRIFLDLMDLPTSRLDEFVSWEEQLLHGETLEVIAMGAANIMGYLEGVIPERRAKLGDDILSTIIQGKVDDRPLNDEEILAMSFLLFFGGLDTVAATMTFIFKHLAEHPEDQDLLRREPELIPGAVEEFLRAYSVVNSPRRVAEDLEFHGVKMKKGERVLLAASLAGRDPEALVDGGRVDLRRKNVRHLAFASGPHMCVGAPLARRELKISLEEWLTRAPPFEITSGDQAITRGRGVFDVQRLPLSWRR